MLKFKVFYGGLKNNDVNDTIIELNRFCDNNDILDIKSQIKLNSVETSNNSESTESVCFIVKYNLKENLNA